MSNGIPIEIVNQIISAWDKNFSQKGFIPGRDYQWKIITDPLTGLVIELYKIKLFDCSISYPLRIPSNKKTL